MKGSSKFNQLKPAIVLSCAISFMFFLYEPITLYANNINDFWFDFYALLQPSLLFFLLSSAILFFFFFALLIISQKTPVKNLYHWVLLLTTFCFICSYIHSNFLAGFLPSLDGTAPDWGDVPANLVSIIVCIVVAISIIVLTIKSGYKKSLTYLTFLDLAIMLLLSISLISTSLTTDIFKPKEFVATSTTKNINLVSNNRNYMILLVDATDSVQFNKIVSKNESYQNTLKDFSYFPDTVSGYAFTRDSIPFIFSGKWNENKTPFSDYSTDAFNTSKFFSELSKQNYNKNFYDYDFIWSDPKAMDFNNIIDTSSESIRSTSLLKQELKYILYKTLPFPIKFLSKIETLDFSRTRQTENDFKWDDLVFYNDYLKRPTEKTDENYFQFIHIEGAHVPFDIDENLEPLPEANGTYPQKLEATMKIVAAYLERLKQNGAYDNSTIIIMADHGYWYERRNEESRANPILYIKGVNETHTKTHASNKQISYEDLSDAFIELLNGKQSTEIFSNIPASGRIRRYIYNGYGAEEHMLEYHQTGNASDDSGLQPTGEEYNL